MKWTMTTLCQKCRQKIQNNVSDLVLALALFFNPAGYDFIFKNIMNIIGSYWYSVAVMYCIAGTFFVIYLILRWRCRHKV